MQLGRADTSKDCSSGLGSSSASFNESECGSLETRARTLRPGRSQFRETHFDSATPPAPPPGYSTLPYTLFHCQHACFGQHHAHGRGQCK